MLAELPVDLAYCECPMEHEMSTESLGDAAVWLRERLETVSSKGR